MFENIIKLVLQYKLDQIIPIEYFMQYKNNIDNVFKEIFDVIDIVSKEIYNVKKESLKIGIYITNATKKKINIVVNNIIKSKYVIDYEADLISKTDVLFILTIKNVKQIEKHIMPFTVEDAIKYAEDLVNGRI